MNYTGEEKKVVEQLCKLLENEFHITREPELKKAPGIFLLDGESHKMIPDLLLRPREHLLKEAKFLDAVIPVEVKQIDDNNCNKFEDLLCQCHSYRFSVFQGRHPKLCLYYISNAFENVQYDYKASKDPKTLDYDIRKRVQVKNKLENFMGRFGIGEIVWTEHGYMFRIKRQILFHKMNNELSFKPSILNFRLGTSGGRIKY